MERIRNALALATKAVLDRAGPHDCGRDCSGFSDPGSGLNLSPSGPLDEFWWIYSGDAGTARDLLSSLCSPA